MDYTRAHAGPAHVISSPLGQQILHVLFNLKIILM